MNDLSLRCWAQRVFSYYAFEVSYNDWSPLYIDAEWNYTLLRGAEVIEMSVNCRQGKFIRKGM